MASAAPAFDRWISESLVDALSESLGEGEVRRRIRKASYTAFGELPLEPNPLYRGYSNLAGADLTGLDPVTQGPPVSLPPAPPATLRVVHDASGTRIELPQELADAGVQCDTAASSTVAVPATGLPPEDKLQALTLAVENRTVRLEVPDRCAVPVRMQDLTILSRPHAAISVGRQIHAGAGSRVLVSEEVYSTEDDARTGQRLYGSTVDVDVSEDAAVHFVGVHAPDSRAISLYHRRARVGRNGRMAWVWAGFGGLRTRTKNLSELPGTASSVDDLQTYYGHADQAYDSSIQIRHIGTDTHGQSITRGVFRDKARGISRGLVRIEKDARKTLSFLSEHAMLLSRGARSETIPVLEILCRDVKATHSSSVAPVDPERVFYLTSRGIPENDAVRMIGEGFLSHVLERASIEQLREHLYPILAARWDLAPVLWADGHYPALPPLAVAEDAASSEWRFDAKLR